MDGRRAALVGTVGFEIMLLAFLLIPMQRPSVIVYDENATVPQQYTVSTSGPAPYVLRSNISVMMQTTASDSITYQVRTNSMGLRDDSLPTQENQTIIAVVGDSMTFGWGVNRSSRFTERCQMRIDGSSRVRIVNAGMPGYGMKDYRGLIKEYIFGIHPDQIIVVFSKGDVVSAADMARYDTYSDVREAEIKSDLRRERSLTRDLLPLMENISRAGTERGIPVHFISYWPFPPQERRLLVQWARRTPNVTFVPAPRSFRGGGIETLVFNSNDPHLNRAAHTQLSRTLCNLLQDSVG